MKTAIVSGVGPLEGLGAQLCVRFADLGLHVLVAGRTRSKLDAVVDSIVSAGGSARAVVADSTSEADTERLFAMAGQDLSPGDLQHGQQHARPYCRDEHRIF